MNALRQSAAPAADLSQESLRDETARRIRAARPDLAARLDLHTEDGLLAAHREITGAAQETQTLTVAVIRRFDLPGWLRGTCEFAHRLAPDTAAAWRRSFTRTVFVAGNPANLTGRFDFDHVADDNAAAWLGPAPAARSAGLRRLLKSFDGSAPLATRPPAAVPVLTGHDPGPRQPVRWQLHIATSGVTVADCLVHLNHLLVEAVLDGVIGPHDELTTRQSPWLVGIPGPFAALRVAGTPERPDRLRAYAALTGP